ncbi:MAG TPA: GTP-binding protein [Bacteroidia bacterium]|jgi:sulfate adenylyltransferase subunit 1|nr:GTP-binding protein [Bacteroidia bacterium]
MDILRFITAGSVDDGKSTLIGRLLYDSKAVSLDILEAIEKQTKNTDNGKIDLSLLTDGLRAEREQGITIDVAYKYFTTAKRKYIIADAPGHIQYTRNMVTGASNANLAIILIDARQGVVEQTRRHTYITSLLGIPHIVVAVNKIDLVDFSEEKFNEIVKSFKEFSTTLNIKDAAFIPVSAAYGDNVTINSVKMPWYKGKNLLQHLEEIEISHDVNLELPRFQVQYVIRPQDDKHHDYRGYAGRISSGIFKKGDKVTILPSGIESEISLIELNNKETDEAFALQSTIIHLKDNIDISRGDSIVLSNKLPYIEQDLQANICWMDTKQLQQGAKLLLQHNSNRVKAVVKEVNEKINLHTLQFENADGQAALNEIVRINIKTATALAYDPYAKNRNNGGFILIDENTNNTVAAGIFVQ